jgi:GntR family transcriptional regulator
MLERTSPVPLYHQLKELLATKLRKGEWRPGELFPGEQELQSTYALSRTTVRQALRELELDGFLTRHRGRGTFVSFPKLTHDPRPGRTLASRASKEGTKANWKVLTASWVAGPADVLAKLNLPRGSKVHELRRLRRVNGETLGVHVAYVPEAFADAIDEGAFTKGSSLAYLEGQAAMRGASVDRVLEANLADEEEAEVFGIDEGAPILCIRRLTLSRAGVPLEYCLARYRGDRFQYHFVSEWQSEDIPLQE